MSNTDKSIQVNDASQVLGYVFNPSDNSLTTGSFLVGKVGRKIDLSLFDAVTEDYTYSEDGDTLYVIRIVYTDADKTTFMSAERIA